jgi:hypothetical protein
MEKTIEIDGKLVKLKSHAAIPLMYKAQFGRDFFSDLVKMNKLKDFDPSKENYEVLSSLDSTIFYNLIWIYAKAADKTIDDPITWLSQFDHFPLEKVMIQVTDLLNHSFKTKKK